MASSWRGIFPSIPTPFTSAGDVDLRAQQALVRFAVEQGAHGIMCFGLAGEVFKLTAEERRRLADVILAEAAGLPVLVGVSAESEHTARELARHAAAGGATGVVVAPPVTSRPSRDELARFFSRVAESAQIPVMIQDAPEYLGVALGPEFVRRLADSTPNVEYVKLETGPDGLAAWREELGDGIGVFGGNGGLHILECMRAGAAGLAPGLEVIDLLVAIYDAEVAGDQARAEQLYREFLPLMVFEIQDIDHYNACAKYVLARRGVALETHLRAPAPALTASAKAVLDSFADSLGLVPRGV